MILVGNQRGGAADLARHLFKDENERVVIHEIRGFATTDLKSAFRESYALSRETRCKQHLFSLSLNPPKDATVSMEIFEAAIEQAENRLGLAGQPRAIVFHEKGGSDGEIRRHAHAVWSRIEADQTKAVPIAHSKRKLQDLAREIYLENDWTMPRGFVRSDQADPRTYSFSEWQQAKRAKKDPRALKTMFQECWGTSDSQPAFAEALREHGYVLARGDRRGIVAVDRDGEVYAVARWVGVRTNQVRAKINLTEQLPSVADAHAAAAGMVVERLKVLQEEERAAANVESQQHMSLRDRLTLSHRATLSALETKQSERSAAEELQRQGRIRGGLNRAGFAGG